MPVGCGFLGIGRELGGDELKRLEEEVLNAILGKYGPVRDEDREDLLKEFSRLARVAAIVIAVYGSEEWFVKYGGFFVAFPDVDPVWWVDVDWAARRPGPGYVCLNRWIYGARVSPKRIDGIERLISGGLDSERLDWREFSSSHQEAAELVQTALLTAWRATLKFGVPVLLVPDEEELALNCRAVLPLRDFRDEDVMRALEAMEWSMGELMEAGFPLARGGEG
ncbi:MAG: hypothetical protein DRO01_02485 [Thermoproteota archaeon]|nr:MAG: hypothetical protein DRO01_02485 [Candidatus Korarchaeota archaeon]